MRTWLSGSAALAMVLLPGVASAQSLVDTLSLAYTNNPTLNAARSTTRSTDEGVAIAVSGYRPRVNATAAYAWQWAGASTALGSQNDFTHPASIQLQLVQPLFTGFQTTNSVKQSESAVRAQREAMRNTEQSVLLDAATAFMDVVRDSAIAGLRETAVRFFTEQVRAARDRFNVGEGTKTDVAQAEARQQLAISQLNAARANLTSSRATYQRVVGVEPKRLNGSYPIERGLPKTVQAAVDIAQNGHPAILSGIHNMDVASFNVKILEGQLLPQLNLTGTASKSWESSSTTRSTAAGAVGLSLTVPLYQGGGEYARIRQAKEQLGTARIQVDVTRDQVRAAVISNWGTLDAAQASIVAARAQVAAAQLALQGVIEEQRVGQRTTLDVLNAQSDLTDAQVNLANAERNRIVAAFALVASIGKLDADHVSLRVARYDPTQHYEEVKDKWFGLRTPDGR